jgi:kynurenine formamidase
VGNRRSASLVRCHARSAVRTVGIDYLSVGGFRIDGVETHRALLEAGIWVIEGLDLSEVDPGEYELVCLPIEVERSDGTPARRCYERSELKGAFLWRNNATTQS